MPDICYSHKNVLWGGIACPHCHDEAEALQDLQEPQRAAMAALYLRLDIVTVLLQNLCESLGVSQQHPDDTVAE